MDDDDSEGSDDMQEEDDDAARTLANELRESCFNGFQSFVLRRPVEIQKHLPQIVHSALAYMRFDPNYSYGDEMDEDEEVDDDDNEYEMDEDDDEYEDEEDDFSDDDDDDDSWKVRRSAIRTLTAVVKASEKNLSSLWNVQYPLRKNKKWKATVADALVNRFKERDESCRVDIVDCFNSLLKSTVVAASAGDLMFTASEDSMDVEDGAQVITDFRSTYANAIVVGCEKQLVTKKAGLQTKSASLSLLSTLCTVPGGIGNAEKINSICQQMKSIFIAGNDGPHSQGTNKELKLDALYLVNTIITCGQHDAVDVKGVVLNVLLEELCKAVQENWYKIISETLKVLSAIPMLLVDAQSDEQELRVAATKLYGAIEPRLAANDFDQEIKEVALESSASLLSTMDGNLSSEQKQRLLSLILLRLKNETTRIAAMKTIVSIVVKSKDSLEKVDMTSFLADFVAELASLLRQSSRSVKQHSIICLDTLIKSYGTNTIETANNGILDAVLQDLSANISDNSDVYIIHLSLQASLSILDKSTTCITVIQKYLLPAVLQLCTFSSLQDKALDSLQAVFQKFIVSNIIAFNELLTLLHSKLPKVPQTVEEKEAHSETSTKKVIGNIAKCMATITSSASEVERKEVVSNLMTSLESTVTTDNLYTIMLALRMSGDLGCIIDLNSMENVGEKLQNIYIASFDSQFEEIKNSAAYGLGRASVGSISTFLPKILSALEQNNEMKKYLPLSALRELIYCHRLGFGSDITPIVGQVLPHLKHNFADKEEGIRTMVADCMGSLACLKPNDILPELQDLYKDNPSDALICWTVATSVKLAVSGGCDVKTLLPFMAIFLELLKADDLNVKNAALLMVYASVHHNPQLVLPFMENQVQPALLEV